VARFNVTSLLWNHPARESSASIPALEILAPFIPVLRTSLHWGMGMEQTWKWKGSSAGNQSTAHIISCDTLHSRWACQKIVTSAKGASGPVAMKGRYKSQPRSQLSHSLLLAPSSWDQGEFEAPSLPLSKWDLSSVDLPADSGYVLSCGLDLLAM